MSHDIISFFKERAIKVPALSSLGPDVIQFCSTATEPLSRYLSRGRHNITRVRCTQTRVNNAWVCVGGVAFKRGVCCRDSPRHHIGQKISLGTSRASHTLSNNRNDPPADGCKWCLCSRKLRFALNALGQAPTWLINVPRLKSKLDWFG